MCSVALVGMGVTAAGGLVSAYGHYAQGQMEKNRLEFNAEIMEDNAHNAELAAEDIKKQGKRGERKHRQNVNIFMGRQKASMGASGVDVSYGAPADVITETALHGEDDAFTIRRNAALEAWGMRTKAADIRSQARLTRIGGIAAETAGRTAAGATLLSTMGTTATRYADWKLKTGGATGRNVPRYNPRRQGSKPGR